MTLLLCQSMEQRDLVQDKIVKINLEELKKIIEVRLIPILKRGSVIVYPTATCYCFVADALNSRALEKVYDLKGRPKGKPPIANFGGVERLKKLVKIPQKAKVLMKNFWPGPLTLILFKKEKVKLPLLLTGETKTLGVNISGFGPLKLLPQKLGKPVIATSANLSGQPAPYRIEEIIASFPQNKLKEIDLFVDIGKLPSNPMTTVLDLTRDPPKILRQGPISKEEIEKVLGEKVEVAPPR